MPDNGPLSDGHCADPTNLAVIFGANTLAQVDLDGDGAADMRILVIGVMTLAESDFLL